MDYLVCLVLIKNEKIRVTNNRKDKNKICDYLKTKY